MPSFTLIKCDALTLSQLTDITSVSHAYINLHLRLQSLKHIISELWLETQGSVIGNHCILWTFIHCCGDFGRVKISLTNIHFFLQLDIG